jgi:hypothetical protein
VDTKYHYITESKEVTKKLKTLYLLNLLPDSDHIDCCLNIPCFENGRTLSLCPVITDENRYKLCLDCAENLAKLFEIYSLEGPENDIL